MARNVILTLLFAGVLTPAEALAGFADPVVLMIAGLFVVGGAIFESGLADAAGRWLGRVAGVRPTRLLVVVMLATALLSAFLSSTGTVAVMLPPAFCSSFHFPDTSCSSTVLWASTRRRSSGISTPAPSFFPP